MKVVCLTYYLCSYSSFIILTLHLLGLDLCIWKLKRRALFKNAALFTNATRTAMSTAKTNNVPVKNKRIRKDLPWFNQKHKQMQRKRNRMYKTAIKYPTDINKYILKTPSLSEKTPFPLYFHSSIT